MSVIWTADQLDTIKSDYKTHTVRELSIKIGVSYNSLRHKMKQMGIGRGRGSHGRLPIYLTNQAYFEHFTEKSAYIIGFIAADGHINTEGRCRLMFGLAEKDRDLLSKIRDEISPDSPIKDYPKNKSVIFNASGGPLIQSLIRLGLDSKKSGIHNIFTQLPQELHKHFIRGFFDGDGSISFRERVRGKYRSLEGKVNICNTNETLLNNITSIIDCGVVKRFKSNNGLPYLYFNSVSDILRFYQYIYHEQTICLERKRNKFQEFLTKKGVL